MMKILSKILLLLAVSATVSAAVRAQTASFSKLGGDRFEFSSEKGKVVVVAIGARWLPLSKNQAAILNALAAKADPTEVTFYFVMVDSVSGAPQDVSTDAQLEEFAKTNKLTATLLRDPKGAASSKLFRPDQLPAFVILGRDGKMVGEAITGMDPKTDDSGTLGARIDRATGKQ